MKSNRVQAFSDGIFTILITILVLEFRLPDYKAGNLASAVLAQWPILFAYVLTFTYIGILWLFHHDLFGHIEKTNAKLNIINLFSIFLTTLLNYSMSLLADSIVSKNEVDMRFSFTIYSGVAMSISASYFLLYSYLEKNRTLLSDKNYAAYFMSIRRFPVISMAIYGVDFVVSMLSVPFGLAFLLLGIVFHGFAYWKTARRESIKY
ncbi:MAG: DUF1211 domain-containing protein [Muribaculaceae bacterium]|jgi:uncharacterized membrane protein|nr:DUF1211 domain-containing protein [Muribaculaceae bacterium]